MLQERKVKQEDIDALYKLLAGIQSPSQMKDLLDDLCTIKEVEQMSQRIKAAKLLMEGMTYTQVMAEAEISSATLSRVSRCVQYGNGYSKCVK